PHLLSRGCRLRISILRTPLCAPAMDPALERAARAGIRRSGGVLQLRPRELLPRRPGHHGTALGCGAGARSDAREHHRGIGVPGGAPPLRAEATERIPPA